MSNSSVMSNELLPTTRRGADGVGVQSVDRAITVLEILARRGEAGVSEVAAEITVHKSTAFRLLTSLENRGLVEQAADRGKYRLGFGIVRLAGAVSARLDVTRHGRSVCERLAGQLGETVNLAVAQDGHAINLDQVRGPSAVTAHNWVGQPTPLHATSSGKVLLAWRDPAVVADLLGTAPLRGFTASTITSLPLLQEELSRVRATGYALTVEEYELGLNAMAAPIREHGGRVVAAVSASGPAYRFTPARMHELAGALMAGARKISHRMGHLD
jgi:DNA-binding IclR family transcriptional regulator